jgi:hypothetical protein
MQWDEENSYLGLTSANASQPVLEITNTHDGTTSGELKFTKNSTGDDSDVMGLISFYGTDSSDNAHERLAYMDAIITDSAHGSEAASLRFYVAENDATLTQGLLIAGQADADGEVDVTIGAGVASTTTVAGNMVVTTRLTASNQFSIGGHVVDDIDLAGEFVDSDNHLMTSAAIDDRIAAAGGGGADEVVSTGEHILKQTKVTFDQAACNDLHTGTVGSRTLVAAQGANKMIVPTEIVVFADRASTSTTGHDLVVAYNGSSAYATSVKYTRRFMHNVGTDRTKIMGPYAGTAANDLTTPVNSALTATFSASCTNNSLTSLTFYTSYYVIDIS